MKNFRFLVTALKQTTLDPVSIHSLDIIFVVVAAVDVVVVVVAAAVVVAAVGN